MPQRLVLAPLPTEVTVDTAFALTVQALDAEGEVVTAGTLDLRLQAFSPLPEWPVISEVNSRDSWIEVANPGSTPLDLANWELVVGREAFGSGFTTHARLRLPRGTVLASGAVFTWSGTGDAPGTFPAWVSPQPFHQPDHAFTAVWLLDPSGEARDEVFLEPFQTPAALTLWRGTGLRWLGFTPLVHSRVGDANRFRSADWVTNLPPSPGALNAGLSVPWQNRGDWFIPTPDRIVLTNGAWTGEVSLPAPAEVAVLVVDNGTGLLARSTPLRVRPWPALTLLVPEATVSASEANAGVLGEVTLRLPAPASTNLEVTLAWSAPAEFASPATLVLPAGISETAFAITNLDDPWADGHAQVTLTAAAPGYHPATATFWNRDDETATLWLTLPPVLREGEDRAAEPGRVWLETPARHDVWVQLAAEPPLEVPPTLLIPAGRSSGAFPIRVGEDAWLNPSPWQVRVTAQTDNWPAAQAFQTLLDNEDPWLTLEVPGELIEGTPARGVLRLRAARTVPLVVSITSPNAEHRARLEMPWEITVPAGVLEHEFSLRAAENDTPEGEPVIELYLAWDGRTTNTEQYVRVLDDDAELQGLELSYGSPRAVLAGQPFRLHARLVTPFGTTYRASLPGRLELLGSPAVAQLAPGSEAIQFVRGVWEGEVTLGGEALGLELRVTAGDHEVVSPPFDLLHGREHRFPFADVQWWAAGSRFLILEPGTAGDPARLTELDPISGDRGRHLDLPRPADRLALADNGAVAWLAAPDNALLRVDLAAWRVDGEFPLLPGAPSARAGALLVLPHQTERLVVALTTNDPPAPNALQLYAAGQRQGAALPLEIGPPPFLLLAGRSADEVFAYVWGRIDRCRVEETGLVRTATHWFNNTASLDLAGEWLIGGNRETASADTLEPGTPFLAGQGELACLPPSRPWAVFLDDNGVLACLDLTSRELVASHAVPEWTASGGQPPQPERLLPWGIRGLALAYPTQGVLQIIESPALGTDQPELAGRSGPQLLLLRSPLVPAGVTPDLGHLVAGQSRSVRLRGSLEAHREYTVTGQLLSAAWDPNPGDNRVSARVLAEAPHADLGMRSLFAPPRVEVGQEFSVSAVLTNAGPDDLTGIAIGFSGATDDEYTLVGCEEGCTTQLAGPPILDELRAGDSRAVTVRFKALKSGLHTLTLYGHVERLDPQPNNDFIGTVLFAASPDGGTEPLGTRLPRFGRYAWDPVSRLILASFEGALSGLVTLDPPTLAPVNRVILAGYVSGFTPCRDGEHAWLFGSDGFTRVNYQTGHADRHIPTELPGGLWAMASPPDRPELLVIIAGDGRVRVYDRGDLRPVSYGPLNFLPRLFFTEDGRLFASSGQQLRELRLEPAGVVEARNLDPVAGWGGVDYTEAAGRLFASDGRVIDIASGQLITDAGPTHADPETGLCYPPPGCCGAMILQSLDAITFAPVWRLPLPGTPVVLTLGTNGILVQLGDFYQTVPLSGLGPAQTDLRLHVSAPSVADGVGYDLPVQLELTNHSAWAAAATQIEVTLSPGLEFVTAEPGSARVVFDLGSVMDRTNLTWNIRPTTVGNHFFRVAVTSSLPDASPDDNVQQHGLTVPDRPWVLFDDLAVPEGHADAGRPLQAWLSRAAPTEILVPFELVPDTTEPGDFHSLNGTFAFAAGQQSAIAWVIRGDATPEPDETATIHFRSIAAASLARTSATLTLLNDDWPEVRAADVSVKEGDVGETNAALHFTLTAGAPFPVELWFRTLPVTANPGTDFLPREGWLVFPPGVTSRTFNVPVLGDRDFEPTETALVSLVDVRGGVPGTAAVRLTIQNDDAPPQPALQWVGSTDLQLGIEFATTLGATYELQMRTNLVRGGWRPVGASLTGTGQSGRFWLDVSRPAEGYFRVRAQ